MLARFFGSSSNDRATLVACRIDSKTSCVKVDERQVGGSSHTRMADKLARLGDMSESDFHQLVCEI